MSEIDAKKLPSAGPTATPAGQTQPAATTEPAQPDAEEPDEAKMALDSEEIGKYLA